MTLNLCTHRSSPLLPISHITQEGKKDSFGPPNIWLAKPSFLFYFSENLMGTNFSSQKDTKADQKDGQLSLAVSRAKREGIDLKRFVFCLLEPFFYQF